MTCRTVKGTGRLGEGKGKRKLDTMARATGGSRAAECNPYDNLREQESPPGQQGNQEEKEEQGQGY